MAYVTKVMDKELINTKIKSIASRSHKLDVDINMVSIQALIHAEMYENYDMAGRLVSALGKSHRAKGLMAWFETFGPFVRQYKGKSKLFTGFKKDKADTATPFNIVDAEQTPFWLLIPEVEVKAVTYATVAKMIDNVLKKASDNLDKDDYRKVCAYANETLV